MSNMSYCRFQNTRNDMEDCLYALETESSLSQEESAAGTYMFLRVLRFFQEHEIIEAYDKDALTDLLRALGQ